VKGAREAWFERQLDFDPEKLVFIDETGATTKMARLYGRAPRGERCRAAVPHGHWKTTTLTAGLRIGGLAAPMILDGPMDGDAFRAYVAQVLVPELESGDVVVMDNLLSWTTFRPIALGESGKQSRPRARHSSTSPRTRRILTRSRGPSPKSRPSYGPPRREQSQTSGTHSRTLSMLSHLMNAETTSPPQDMTHSDRKLL
jgi:DDE superfamily endonuclease